MVLSHRFHIGTLAAALTLFSLSAIPAHADLVTGFEPPAYAPGALVGQNGWSVFGPGLVIVQNTFAFAGSQSVFVDGGAATQTGPYLNTTAGPLVDLSAEIWLSSSGNESGWQFAQTGLNLLGYAGGIDLIPTSDPTVNNVEAITGTGVGFLPVVGTFTRNQWNNVAINLNFTSQTYNIVINGVTLDSNVPFCGNNTAPCNGAPVSNAAGVSGIFDTFGGVVRGNDDGFIDNYSDVTVATGAPEPSFGVLLGLGFAGLAVVRRRRGC